MVIIMVNDAIIYGAQPNDACSEDVGEHPPAAQRAHNEPTPNLMLNATRDMESASLWSHDTFLTQPLAQEVSRELGEPHPESPLVDPVRTIRAAIPMTTHRRQQAQCRDEPGEAPEDQKN